MRTCGTCDHAAILRKVFDANENGKIDYAEVNAMWYTLNGTLIPIHAWRTFVRDHVCLLEGVTDEKCWTTANFPEIDLAFFKFSGGRGSGVFSKMADNYFAALMSPSALMPDSFDSRALRVGEPVVLEGASNLAIQEENFVPVFPTCASHADCRDLAAFACGNLDAPKNELCSRRYEVPLYCATACRTGGCGEQGGVLPNVEARFCQPCDACVLEAPGFLCPDWCSGFLVNDTGGFANKSSATTRETQHVLRASEALDLPGSFTLSAWVRKSEQEWIFERRIESGGGPSLREPDSLCTSGRNHGPGV